MSDRPADSSAEVRQRIDVPARKGRFARLRRGQAIRVIDSEGGQVGDLFAFSVEQTDEHLSANHTRAIVNRLFPQVGEAFYTNRRRPILSFERDDSPGLHDMLIAACDPERYRLLGVTGEHDSCAVNCRDAVAEAGHSVPEWVPQPVNLFMIIPVDVAGNLTWEPTVTQPGDSVTLRAMMDCLIVVSACPQDIVPINNLNPTGLRMEVLAPH
jgi:uncharacterized protein YcgI (DUF1989 family)